MTRFKEARIKAGLSQKAVAITLGVRSPSVWAWEQGETMPTAKNLEALSKLYNVSIDYLLGKDEKKPANEGELDAALIDMLVNLPPEYVQRVEDFVAGLKAAHTK